MSDDFLRDVRKRPKTEGPRHAWEKHSPQHARCVKCGAERLTERAKTKSIYGTLEVVTYRAAGASHYQEKRPPCNDGKQGALFSHANRATEATDDPREGVIRQAVAHAAKTMGVPVPDAEWTPAPRVPGAELPPSRVEVEIPYPDGTVATLSVEDRGGWLENEYEWVIFTHGETAPYREVAFASVRGADLLAKGVMERIDRANEDLYAEYVDVWPAAEWPLKSVWVVARRVDDKYTRAWNRSASGWIFREKGDRREL